MSNLLRFTNNSLATILAWLSTCLLAGGMSTLFNESTRTMWLLWGCFGLIAAVGLDRVARTHERKHLEDMKLIAAGRFERDMQYANEENEAKSSIGLAVSQILGRSLPSKRIVPSQHVQQRYACDLSVELSFRQREKEAAGKWRVCVRTARITNLSEFGFELSLSEPIPRHKMEIKIPTANYGLQTMLGEVLWCTRQPGGSFIAGGRFLDVLAIEDTLSAAHA